MTIARRLYTNNLIQLFILVLVSRLIIGLGIFLGAAYLPFKNSFSGSMEVFNLNLPNQIKGLAVFDAVHYKNLSQDGYNFGLSQAFFPLFPLVGRNLSQLTTWPFFVTGQIVSTLLLFMAAVLWHKILVIKKHPRPIITLALLILFPTAYYFFAPYTESLFLCLLSLFFYFLFKKHYVSAALLAALCSATRITGVLTGLILAFDYGYNNIYRPWSIHKLKSGQIMVKLSTLLFLFVLSIFGLFGYMYYLNNQFHDPLMFLHVQSQFGAGRSSSLVLYPQVVWRSIKILLTQRPFDLRYLTSVFEFLSGALAILPILWLFKYRTWLTVTLFSLLAFIMPTLTGNFSSMPRYILLCPAIYIALGYWLNSKTWLYFFLTLSTILLLICSALFSRGYWIA